MVWVDGILVVVVGCGQDPHQGQELTLVIDLQKVVVGYVLVEDHSNLGHMGVVMLEETQITP